MEDNVYLKTVMILVITLSAIVSQTLHAEEAPECQNTWITSSASASCGANYCTYHNMNFFSPWDWYQRNPDNVFESFYDANKKECTFQTLCAKDEHGPVKMSYENGKPDRSWVMSLKSSGSNYQSWEGTVATCYYTAKTVQVGTRLKNHNGQLEIEGAM